MNVYMNTHKIIIIMAILVLSFSKTYSKEGHYSALNLNSSYIKKENDFRFGFALEYEYFFKKTRPDLGVGLITQANIYKDLELIAAPSFYIHPAYRLTFFLAPGVLYYDYAGVIDEIANTDPPTYIDEPGSKFRSFVRIGAKYDFPVDRLLISPILSFDIIGNNYRLQLGASVGLKF